MADPFPVGSEVTPFTEAVDALRHGDRNRARDLFTALIKEDQNNASLWVWLSAAVDNPKERIYCLQTALKLDPANGPAKRGLVLLGALAPDETVQPFPVNRPRAWEDRLRLADEKPREGGLKVLVRSPAVRLLGTVLLSAGLCAAVVFGYIIPYRYSVSPTTTNTPGPSPTFTFTPTLFGATAAATSTYIGPTPLWMMLPATYTATPLYVSTPRDPQNYDQARSAESAFRRGDWDGFIQDMRLMARLEPNSADIYYYIGEAYRFKGEASNALDAYNNALRIDPDFGPPYLGLARARLIQDPNVNVEYLFNEAIARDPDFGEVYLERARYYIRKNDPEAAIVDLNRADQLLPESPLVQLAYADAYLILEDPKNALAYAEKAYALDLTNLSIYPLLGELYIDDGQYQRGVEALELYVVYEEDNSFAFALLGRAYYELEDYERAIERLDTAFTLNPTGSRRFYVYRGLAHLELDHIEEAVFDLERAFEVDRDSFDVNLGLVKSYYLQEKFGNAFLKVEGLKSIAETDEQIAHMLYWRALVQEKRGETNDAVRSWQDLLAVGEEAVSAAMRLEAEQHLRAVVTPTNTPKIGTPTPTPRGTRTPTRTPAP